LKKRSPYDASSSSSDRSEDPRRASEIKDLKERLSTKIKKARRAETVHTALKILERNAKLDQTSLREMLEMGAAKPGAAVFTQIIAICQVGKIRLNVPDFAKIVGNLVQRGAPIAQVRLVLNLVVPRGEPAIPLVPPGLEPEEVDAVYADEAPDEDSQAEDEADKGDMTREAPAEKLEIVGCKAHAAVNGPYELDADTTSYGRPTYKRSGDERGMVHYKRDEKGSFWAVSLGFGEQPLLVNRRDSRHPPRVGWQAVLDRGRQQADAAVLKAVIVSKDPVKASAAAAAAAATGHPQSRRESLKAAQEAMAKLDLSSLRGSVLHTKEETLEYFSHFCVLMHLELMAEVASIRKRRQRTPKDLLVRTGWALDQLMVRSVFGRRDGGRRMLPGWEDTGSEMIAFRLPPGFDLERCRLGKGDCVTVSETDPLLDRAGEGLVTDVKPGVMVVQMNGRFQDQQGKTWRLDKAANRVVYERQFTALLQLAGAESQPPCCELLVAAEVGGVDDWVEAMKQGRTGGGPHLRPQGGSRSRGRSRSRSRSGSRAGPGRGKSRSGSKSMSMSISRSRSRNNGRKKDQRRSERRRSGRSASGSKKRTKQSRAVRIASDAPKDLQDMKVLEQVDEEVGTLKDLNKSQRAAVLNALMRTCTIIQGPPGTGKTHVSVQVLRLMAKTLKAAPLLAASDSNVAVDNIAAGLQKAGVRVVRLGRPEKVRSLLDDITLEAQLRQEKEKVAAEEAAKASAEQKAKSTAKQSGAGKKASSRSRSKSRSPSRSRRRKSRSRSRRKKSRSRSSSDSLGRPKRRGSRAADDREDTTAAAAIGRPTYQAGKGMVVPALPPHLKGKGKGGGKFQVHGSDNVDLEAEHAARKRQRQKDMELQLKILQSAEVVCTTTIAAGGEILSKLNFSGILVDEVAQATELSVMVPIVLRGGKTQKRLVLVGDHCQLPPGIQSQEAETRGLSLSIYSRLQRAGIEPAFLDTQYRSHPKLAEFSSEAFYSGALGSGVDGAERPAPKGIPWPNKDVPVAFVEVGSPEEAEGDSKSNTAEAQRVMRLVAQIVAAQELGFDDIGVVTPYVAQVRKLRQLFRTIVPPNFDFRRLEVASVDAFQGREKEIIIFSAVRCNAKGNVGFLGDWRRLNVMLTRARRGLVVFGTASTLCNDHYWDRWLKWCEKNGAVHGGDLKLTPPDFASLPLSQPMPVRPQMQMRPPMPVPVIAAQQQRGGWKGGRPGAPVAFRPSGEMQSAVPRPPIQSTPLGSLSGATIQPTQLGSSQGGPSSGGPSRSRSRSAPRKPSRFDEGPNGAHLAPPLQHDGSATSAPSFTLPGWPQGKGGGGCGRPQGQQQWSGGCGKEGANGKWSPAGKLSKGMPQIQVPGAAWAAQKGKAWACAKDGGGGSGSGSWAYAGKAGGAWSDSGKGNQGWQGYMGHGKGLAHQDASWYGGGQPSAYGQPTPIDEYMGPMY